ncbi:MAG: FkbM family methyltransferase [Verrucomicrobiota bacterium]
MSSRLIGKLNKVIFSLSHPRCWVPLSRGVAPAIEHASVLADVDCDLLLDVGANRGQFSLISRVVHPKLRIQAFEPQPGEAAVYRSLFEGDPLVRLHEVALGDKAGEADLHISRRADSSSLLPIGELQAKLFPSTEEVGVHRVPVVTLDSLVSNWTDAQRIPLSSMSRDVELSSQGARVALQRCAFVYAECSEVPLYTGQALYPEVASFLQQEGFRPVRKANEQYVEGQLVQADHLFGRT